MTTLVAGTAFDMHELILGGSLSEFFEFGEPVNGSLSNFTVMYQDGSVIEQLTVYGSFTSYGSDGYPATGTITGLEYVIGTTTIFTVSNASITVQDFKGFVSNDDMRGLFAQIFVGADQLTGSSGDDTLTGFAGNDTINGGGGTDTVDYSTEAGNGDVYVNLQDGAVFGQAGMVVDAHQARDTYGNIDTLTSIERVITGFGNDTVLGTSAGEYIETSAGNDFINGGGGADTLVGGMGNDNYVLTGTETVVELAGGGIDRITTAQGSFSLAGYGEIENLRGVSEAGQALTGNDLGNLITAWLGSDTLEGGAGNDRLFGDAGNDTLRGGIGNDELYGGEGNDLLSEASGDNGPFGNDLYDGGNGIDRVSMFTTFGPGVTIDLRLTTAQNTGSMGTDTFVGIEHITANYGDDTLTGNDQANWFWTFSGTDSLSGLGGDDYFTVGAGNKVADGGTGIDTIEIADTAFEPLYTQDGITVSLALQGTAQAVGTGTWTLTNIENLGGYFGDDELTGDGNANVLAGQLGNDTLIGSGGNDRLLGDGTWIMGDDGVQTLVEVDTADGPGGNDVLNGGTGDDYLNGGGGADVQTGGSGNDIFLSTAEDLNGDTITDLDVGDRIVISDATLDGFTFSLDGTTLNYTGGSLTLSGPVNGMLTATAAIGGGVQLTIEPVRDVANDFNGDGHSDILWRNDNGTLTNWLGQDNGSFAPNNGNFVAGIGVEWTIAATGDFNGDLKDDILWRNTDGVVSDWLGQANGSFTSNAGNFVAGVGTDWTVVGSGDFNGDGKDDLLWRNDNGTITDWLGAANGGFTPNNGNFVDGVATSWSIAGIGDFNGDGKDDLLWRNDNGTLTNWLGQTDGGFTPNNGNFVNGVGAEWTIVGTGDFNGDGMDDILWRNDNGALTDWLGQENGSFTPNNGNFVAGVASDWTVAQIGDFNGDGNDDILWRNTNGTVSNWLGQDNGSFASNAATFVAGVGTDWHIQPPELI